ncbi:MAG: hypothetical protein LBJ67_11145, partial [Planctomycetaceae bacterium]|nr:hypothetical protein [Planctomycetaceae bacterium]
IEELKAMQAKLESLNEPLPTPYAGYLGEDWKTQGDWTGRIYRDFAMMCAAVSPFDRLIVISDRFYGAYPFIGPNQEKYDDVRYWVHWVKTDNPKSLWDPVNGYRRQAEWDDHGEAYPLTQDGPDLWYVLDINRTGVFRIGMYFYNKDGHAGMNRLRDYEIEFYPSPKDWIPDVSQRKDFVEIGESLVRKESPLLKSRVSDFWGGVHKQFIVTGPMPYLVKIRRNNSYNTILSSVTVDRLIGVPTYVEEYGIPFSNFVKYEPPPLPSECSSGVGSQILLLWEELDKKYAFRKNVNVQRQYRVAAYQAASAFSSKEAVMNQLAYSLKWRLNQWDDAQRQEWMTIMKQNWQIFYDTNPTLRKTIESHKYGVPEIFKDWPH